MRQIPGYLRNRIYGLRQLSPSPIHQGMLENSTWHWDSVLLLNNLPSDPIVPQWGRQAAAHSRVIDWINSLIPNRWIEYWCLVSPNHRRKTQSASTAWKFNPLFPQHCNSEPCSFSSHHSHLRWQKILTYGDSLTNHPFATSWINSIFLKTGLPFSLIFFKKWQPGKVLVLRCLFFYFIAPWERKY